MSSSGQFWFFPGLQAGLIPPPPRSEGSGFESVRRLHRDYKVLRERCESWRKRDLELSNQLLEASVPSPPCFRSAALPSAFASLPPATSPALFPPGTAGILKTTYGPRNRTNRGCHVTFGETKVHIVERWIKRKNRSRSKSKSRSPRVTAHPSKSNGVRSLPYEPAGAVDGQSVSGECPVPFVRELIGIPRKEMRTDIPGPVTWTMAIGCGIAACAAVLFTRWLEA
ncbi:hypothetical protein N7454_001690 [Penicillium verhagenii]|nr:hypothetical protein N7454_001690 [Penicillium verhagenii]